MKLDEVEGLNLVAVEGASGAPATCHILQLLLLLLVDLVILGYATLLWYIIRSMLYVVYCMLYIMVFTSMCIRPA